jgi:hypothetical protein
VLRLLEPYGVAAPTDRIGPDCVLDAVTIDRAFIRLTIKKGEAALEMTLGVKGNAPGPLLGTTPSFDVWLSSPAAPPAEVSLQAAARQLLLAVQENDTGEFWSHVPEMQDTDNSQAEIEAVAGRFFWFDFVGEALLLALIGLFVASRKRLAYLLAGHSAWFWVGLGAVLALGTAYRVGLTPEKVEEMRALQKECGGDLHCNDLNPCTADRCSNQTCRFSWAPPAGIGCCQSDSDCPPQADRCLMSICSPDTSLCTATTRPECNIEPYAGQSRPPLNTSVGWFFAVPAKFLGNTPATAALINLALSVLSIGLLALLFVAWGAPSGMGLAAAFLASVTPLHVMTAQATSMLGFLLFFGLLFLLALAALLRTMDAGGGRRDQAVLAALVLLLFSILASARVEAFLLTLPAAWLLMTAGRKGRLGKLPAAILAGGLLVTALSRILLLSEEELRHSFPPLAKAGAESTLNNLDLLLGQGVALPFIMVLLALVGIPVLYRRFRPVFWLALLLFLALPGFQFVFAMDGYEALRYAALPAFALVAFGGAGLWRLATSGLRFSRLAVAILVLYFALFPASRVEQVRGLAARALPESHFFQL